MKTRTLVLALAASPAFLLNVSVAAEPVHQQLPKAAQQEVDFARDIKPLLENSCLKCHGPVKPKSGHRVDTREAIIKGGESEEAAIVPGKSDKSPLVHYISGLVPDMEMPPLDNRDETPALTREQIALVRAWIDQGAPWPEGVALAPRDSAAIDPATTAAADSQERNPLFAHIREGNTPAIAAALADRSLLQSRDAAGNTPLMQAALYLDAATLQLFLENGADPNATNRAGATALMKAAVDLDKVRTLLDHGAKINTQSNAGNTALIVACRQHGAVDAVNELLARGADVHAATPTGLTALAAAAETGDEDILRTLLARGANPNATVRAPYSSAAESVLMTAAQFGHEGCVKLLLEHGADPLFTSGYGNALHFAAKKERLAIARLLIDSGVEIDLPARRISSFRNDFGLTPLMYAAVTERDDPALINLLIDRGANVNAKTPGGETALSLARKRGETKIVAALKAAGARLSETDTSAAKPHPRWTQEELGNTGPEIVRKSAEHGLAALLQSSVRFNEATAGRCVSCHQHFQPALVIGLAREKRFDYDDTVASQMLKSAASTVARRLDVVLEEPTPVPSISAWSLLGLHAAAYPADELTDGLAYSLARSQFSDGRWITRGVRPPTDYSDITSTALAVRSLAVYAPPSLKASFQRRIDRAANWLRNTRPGFNEEWNLKMLGLHWAGTGRADIREITETLLQQQQENGGWAQLPTLKSDAYATGLTLFALNQAGGLSTSHPVYERGIRFLLNEQLSDGSWLVETRASPVQVAVDDIFPHGQHQWISTSATTWSTLALMLKATSPGEEGENARQLSGPSITSTRSQ